ncbi:LAME_0H12486g1_1 [Lachancea meyersii CBS 8951]|uniref:LAME_0H12486g1_1 n=1 Tax=Lachancea meyersii CBS 8951 TaxID=1266667 RepID=A0A1G4KGQ6_9SACH|nr:LAME_0H12486g1_1 [Lachancea meyersii CBS 8951]
MTQQDLHDRLGRYSNNSLDIRSGHRLGLHDTVESSSNTSISSDCLKNSSSNAVGGSNSSVLELDGTASGEAPVSVPNSFVKPTHTHKQASPTAVTDLLAMLDDHAALHSVLQLTDSSEARLPTDTQLLAQTSNSNSNSVSNSSGLSPQGIIQDSTLLAPEEDPLETLSRSLDKNGAFNLKSYESPYTRNTPLSPSTHSHSQPQPCINPNLLSNANSQYVDSGYSLDRNSPPDNYPDDDSASLFDEFSFQRRMSELASSRHVSRPELQHRNSISYNTDAWNLPSSTSTTMPSQKSHRSFGGILPSSTTTVRPASTEKRSESLRPGSLSTSPFKIDNELTKLLDDYNLNYSAAKPTKTRTGSLNSMSNARRPSVSESQHRVQKQRASMSLVDGNNLDLIAKLYGDIKAPRPKLTSLSWENAIMSDDEDDESGDRDTQAASDNSMTRNTDGEIQLRSANDENNEMREEALDEEDDDVTRVQSAHLDLSADFLSHNLKPTLTSHDAKFVHPNLLMNNQSPLLDISGLSTKSNTSGLSNSFHQPTTTSPPSSSYPGQNAIHYNNNQNSGKPRKRQSFSKVTRNSKSSSPFDEDEKPFKCQECTKAFRRSEHLKRHIRSVHSTERPFHCSYCDKKFSRSDNLSQHLKTHKKHGDF